MKILGVALGLVLAGVAAGFIARLIWPVDRA